MSWTPRPAALPALVILGLLLPTPAAAQYRRAPTLDDILDLVQVSSPQISPDGTRVIYTRSEIKAWKDNKRVSTIWIAQADGTNTYQFLGHDQDRSPKWSPDGRLVAFLSSRDGGGEAPADGGDAGAQIWVIRSTGGEAWQLTARKAGVRTFEWLHDSSGLVFTAPRPKTDAEKAAAKAGDDAIAVDEGPNGQASGTYSHLWMVKIADKTESQVTTADEQVGSFAPSPDGRRAAFTYRTESARNDQFLSEVALVEIATGERRDLTDNAAPESDVQWSPDGALVTFTAPSDREWELAEDKLWAVEADGGPARRLTVAVTGAIRSYHWAPDSRSIYFAAVWRARGAFYRLDVRSGAVRELASGDWIADLDSVSADLGLGAGVVSSPALPGDVHLVDLTDGTRRKITDVNPQMSTFSLATCRSVVWKSQDGTEIEGLLWLPAETEAGRDALPLLVSVHGGPAGVWTTSFRPINHVYASLGWAVLEPNVRGSSSYGDGLLRGNMNDIGGGDFQDLMTGVDAVVAQGIADPDLMGIRGWSYGGILGGWTITRTDRFKGASLGAMVTDWASEYAMGFNFDIRRWYIGGTPWDNPEGYHEQSSYSHVARVKTPTILFHGERDTTDTIGQSMMFYQGLADRDVPTRFLRFPREPHGFREPHHQRIRDAEEIAWLMKHVRGIDWKAPEREDDKKTTKTDNGGGR